MIRLLFFWVACIVVLPNLLLGQELIQLDWKCTYDGESLATEAYTFSSDAEANAAVEQILKYTGLSKNFVVRAADVPNAMAIIQGQTRYILYNQTFMMQVSNTVNTDWAAKSILAHEIGHHLQGHTITSAGSRPDLELQADRYSGFVLQKMGATVDDAQSAMRSLGSEQGTSTHPPKSARLAAIVNGWIEARDLPKPSASTPNPNPAPQTQTVNVPPAQTNTTPQQPTYVARCVFQGDVNSYYVSSNNDIIGVNSYGQTAIVGKRTAPTFSGFVWMYATPYITYGVDSNGVIWNRYPNGVPYQVGYVTSP